MAKVVNFYETTMIFRSLAFKHPSVPLSVMIETFAKVKGKQKPTY